PAPRRARSVAQRKRCGRPASARSSARRVQGRAQYHRLRRRAGKGRADRAAVPTTSAAMRAAAPSSLARWSTCSSFPSEFRHSCVAMTGHEMIVDHPDGLHERVDDGGADEFETLSNQFLRYFFRQWSFRRHLLGRAEFGLLWLSVVVGPQKI